MDSSDIAQADFDVSQKPRVVLTRKEKETEEGGKAIFCVPFQKKIASHLEREEETKQRNVEEH